MGRIFVIRHGQTTHNADRIIQGPRIDSDLSALGRQQAEAVGQALRSHDLDVVVSSPLARARQTAQSIVDAHQTGRSSDQVTYSVAPGLYELDYGTFSGQTYDAVADEVAQILDAWQLGFIDQPFPGGESALLAQHRIREFAARLRATDKRVAVVAHGRINRILLATLTGDGLTKLEEYPQDNGNVTELQTNGSVEVVRRNDVRHLDLGTSGFS